MKLVPKNFVEIKFVNKHQYACTKFLFLEHLAPRLAICRYRRLITICQRRRENGKENGAESLVVGERSLGTRASS
ncbi:hypothetical protein PUN28_004631 [Cardiocondyla obscurior]|uniref:Uncharacterized protein n=1 Tax=Cardiocondyla obscurior TaxID=286306 RepID=A0AAW2GGJ0_9HYME